MKTSKIRLNQLRNEEHFQFMTEFKNSVEKYGAPTLDIANVFPDFVKYYSQELEALQVIRKSATTEQLEVADNERDDIFRGLANSVETMLYHFSPEKKMAAARLKVVFDQYGNIARKPYDEETASISKLLDEAKGGLANDFTTLGLNEWLTQLELKNSQFDALMKSRYQEDAGKTELRMKQVRNEMDLVYRSIADRLDALMLINGETAYEPFVRELNTRVERYNDTVAMRKGRNAKDEQQVKPQTTNS